jgi:hypothetical protein
VTVTAVTVQLRPGGRAVMPCATRIPRDSDTAGPPAGRPGLTGSGPGVASAATDSDSGEDSEAGSDGWISGPARPDFARYHRVSPVSGRISPVSASGRIYRLLRKVCRYGVGEGERERMLTDPLSLCKMLG